MMENTFSQSTTCIFMSPIAKRGHIVFALSLLFVGLTTLTFVITFESFEIEPLFLACRFLVTRASHSYKKIDL